MDSHRDIVLPTAFNRTLSEWRGQNKLPTMYMQHEQANPFLSARPAGVWQHVEPDSKGLAVKGQLIALDTEFGKLNYAQMRDGGMRGLSIAFTTPPGGAESKKGSDGKQFRQLSDLNLISVDIVAEPSNPGALVQQLKAMLTMPNHQEAAQALQDAHNMCMQCMGGGDAPTTDERNQITGKIKEAYRHVTGSDMPAPVKAIAFDQLREFKNWLKLSRDENGRGFSNSQADEIANLVFKSTPRDESGDQAAANAARKEIVAGIRSALSGFSLNPGD
jgi:HK97 family phage prohead protease